MVFPAALNATAPFLPTIYLILWYKVSLVTTGLRFLLVSCFQLYPTFKGTILASVLLVILVAVFLTSLELGGDDVHTDELLPPFIRVFLEVLMVCHTAAEGTCELVDNDIDHCPIRYLVVGVQSINFIKIILDLASLPEFVNLQVCPVRTVLVCII